MKKKHILLLHHVSDQGGGTKSLIDIALMLKDEYDVTVCIPKGSSQTIHMANSYGIKTYEVLTQIPTLNVFSGGPTIFNRTFLRGIWRFRNLDKIVKEIVELKPDIVILNSIVTSIIARKLKRNIKVICFIRETLIVSPFNPFNKLFKYTLEKYVDGVAFIAEHEQRILALSKPITVVIPDVLEPTTIEVSKTDVARACLGYIDNMFYILYMGGGARLKGFDTILKAMTYLDNDCRALIVGNVNKDLFTWKNILMHLHNPKFALFLIRTRCMLKKLRGKKIDILGYQSDISKLMSACDVVVFPSYKPHQPRPCIEAGMYYKPVILSDFEATREYFINNYNALTFKPRNGKNLAEKIYLLKNNPDLKKQIGENNYFMSMKLHSFDEVKKKIMSFIYNVIENQ